MSIILIGSLIILLLIGAPMFIVMFLPAVLGLKIFMPNIPAFTLVQRAISGVEPFPLLAIPLFIYAADIMMEGEMANRLLNFCEKILGHLVAGLAQSLILGCLIFGAVSGSTQAAVAAIGGNMYKRMLERGYSKSFTLALIIDAADVAQLIPPSTFLILYGAITGTSIAELFIAGIGPGIFLGIAFMIYSYWWAKRNRIPTTPRASFGELISATKQAITPLGFIVIIIGGIYTGTFTPTEAAAVAVGYSVIIETLIFRSIGIKDLHRIAFKSGMTTALCYILVGGAMAFIWILTIANIPQDVTKFLVNYVPNKICLLFLINAIFFVALCFFPPFSTMLILTPILWPTVLVYNVDPVHLGVLICLNSAIGSCTPPFGVDIFTACAIFREPFDTVISGVLPFIAVGVIVLTIVTVFPDIALFLPRLYK